MKQEIFGREKMALSFISCIAVQQEVRNGQKRNVGEIYFPKIRCNFQGIDAQ